jgi:hypothetical protein
MPRLKSLQVGILFAVLPLLVLSCGERKPTEPTTLAAEIPAVPVYDAFYSPIDILTVARELLIDARATQIEWDGAGAGNFVLMKGVSGGGNYYANIRAEWTRDKFEQPRAVQLLIQWPDFTENRLDHPIVDDAIDVYDPDGNLVFNCATDNRIIQPTSWHRSDALEDQVEIEIFPTAMGGFPCDDWRWGAATTDFSTPVSPVDFPGADGETDVLGAFTHPQAAFCEDRWNTGSGPVPDAGPLTYAANYTQYANGVVPKFVAGKGTRDTRLNRLKPIAYTIWRTVQIPLGQCTLENPIRVDDAAVRDNSWNPGDYVPGWVTHLPFPPGITPDSVITLVGEGLSSGDVLARGAWEEGKWSLEIRRLLDTGHPADDLALTPPDPNNANAPEKVYGIRITIRDGQTKLLSRSAIIPFVFRPAPSK